MSTIREYAYGRLIESGEADDLHARHAHYLLQLAEDAAPHLLSAQRPDWLPRLQIEHDNFRAALAWSGEHAIEIEARLVTALVWFWYFAGYISEGRAHLEHALQRAGEIEQAALRAHLTFAAGAVAAVQGDYAIARERLVESVEAFRQLDDLRRRAYAVLFLALTTSSQGDPQTGLKLLRESLPLFRQAGDRWGEAYALSSFGDMILSPADVNVLRSEIEDGSHDCGAPSATRGASATSW